MSLLWHVVTIVTIVWYCVCILWLYVVLISASPFGRYSYLHSPGTHRLLGDWYEDAFEVGVTRNLSQLFPNLPVIEWHCVAKSRQPGSANFESRQQARAALCKPSSMPCFSVWTSTVQHWVHTERIQMQSNALNVLDSSWFNTTDDRRKFRSQTSINFRHYGQMKSRGREKRKIRRKKSRRERRCRRVKRIAVAISSTEWEGFGCL